jgi:serine phosphatase RsbU (regulator of sigma subunit)
MPRRLVVVGEREHDFVDLDDRSTVSIGRSPENDVVIQDDMASRRHAVIERDAAGELRVRDLKSFNGTYLNERRVRDEPYGLWDAVRIGRTKIFMVERHETPAKPESDEGQEDAAREEPTSPSLASGSKDGEDPGSATRTLDPSDEEALASKEMRAIVDGALRRERESIEREISQRIRDESGPSVLGTLAGFRVRVQRDGPLDGGGDFHDVFRDSLLPNDLFLAAGSVSGVGVAACVAATVARHSLRGYLATRNESPERSLHPCSEVLASTLHPGSALSLLQARLDSRGTMDVAALGGCGVLHYKAATGQIVRVRAPGRRDEEAARVQSASFDVREGDRVLLLSDGAGAMRRTDGEPFGVDRLEAALVGKLELPGKELLAHLRQVYSDFVEGTWERDVTIILVSPGDSIA